MIKHIFGKAARAIAAMLHLAAVAVKNAVGKIRLRIGRGFDNQQLVKTHAGMAIGQCGNALDRPVKRRARGIQHHEIIAQAVHLGESRKRHASHPHKRKRAS